MGRKDQIKQKQKETLSECQAVLIQIFQSRSGSKLFAKVISRRQKLLLAKKE